MGTINCVGSLRYDMHGRKRKTKSLKVAKPIGKIKKELYNPSEDLGSQMDAHRKKNPSRGEMIGNTHKKETNVYTGSLIIGIATMHKSNAVPVSSSEQATDISRMSK